MTDAMIRSARPDDAKALGVLGRETFIDTFVTGFGIPYPEPDLGDFLQASFSPEAVAAKLVEPGAAWWVAERDGELLAFANAGPNTLPHPDARPTQMELRRLYVARAAQGLGLGTRLLSLSLDWMEAHTNGPLWIGVWSGNVKAQRLYATHGFGKVGEYQYPVGRWLDDEFIPEARIDYDAAMTRAELLEKLRELKPWLEEQGIVNVRLFGSYARDEAGPDSDVDLLVEMTKPLGFDFFGIEDALTDALGVRVEMGTERSMHRLLRERCCLTPSMSDFKDRLHLVEMLDAIGEIEMDTGGLSEDAWVEVGSLVRAVSMSLITLGEGAAQLSDALKESAPDVPWRRMIGLRNRLAHAYFRADRHIIWQAATQHTPNIKEQLLRLLAALPDS